MAEAPRIALVLLAAGRSARFGGTDKLAAVLGGVPLALHAARALAPLPFAARFAVAGATALDFAREGYMVVRNDAPAAGQSRSLALGVAAARTGADAILIALADMPFVGAAHVRRLLDRYDGPATLVASADGRRRSPPALFGAEWFDTLETRTGDSGARALLRDAAAVIATPGELADIDTPSDLASAGSTLSDDGRA